MSPFARGAEARDSAAGSPTELQTGTLSPSPTLLPGQSRLAGLEHAGTEEATASPATPVGAAQVQESPLNPPRKQTFRGAENVCSGFQKPLIRLSSRPSSADPSRLPELAAGGAEQQVMDGFDVGL